MSGPSHKCAACGGSGQFRYGVWISDRDTGVRGCLCRSRGFVTRATEKAQEHLDELRLSDTHSSDVDPGDYR